MKYNWNWGIFWDLAPDGAGVYFTWLISGLGWTVATALAAWIIALALGTVIGTLRTTPVAWVVRLGNAYVELFRNVPLLVQLFLWYFVLPELVPKAMGDAVKQLAPPWGSYWPAVLCLGFYTSARVAEQIKAGILSLPRGQTMAGTALGLTLPQTYRHVLLPMAFRIVLPPLTSEFMNIIKNSAVALTIGLVELTARARHAGVHLPGVRGLHRRDRDLHPAQYRHRARHALPGEEGLRARIHRLCRRPAGRPLKG